MSNQYSERERIFVASSRNETLAFAAGMLMIVALGTSALALWTFGGWALQGRFTSDAGTGAACVPIAVLTFWSYFRVRTRMEEARSDLDAAMIGAGLKPHPRWSIRHPWRV